MTVEELGAVLRVASGVFSVLGLPVLVYVARLLRDLDVAHRQHAQTLYGEKGDNGLKSDVLRLRGARHELAGIVQGHEFRLDDHGRRLEKLEDAVP